MRRQGSSISSRGARRLLRGAPSADPREQRVAAVLAALAPDDASDTPVPENVLRAFTQQAPEGVSRRSGTRVPRIGRAAALKVAVAVLAVSSGTVAAAAADVLPAPAQRAAHSLLGGWGVPAPHSAAQPPASSPPTTPPSAAETPSTRPSASHDPTASHSPTTSHGHTASHGPAPSPSPSASEPCPESRAHAANAHCPTSPDTSPSVGNGHASQTTGHGHTPTPHSSAAH